MKEQLINLSREKGFMSRDSLVTVYDSYYPLWMCELQKWTREVHYIYITVVKQTLGSDEWGFAYEISYLPKEFEDAKRRCPHFINIDSFHGGGASYAGAWDTYEEALENGLLKALNLIQTKQ